MSVEWTIALGAGFTTLTVWAMGVDLRHRPRGRSRWWFAVAAACCLVAWSMVAFAPAMRSDARNTAPRTVPDLRIVAVAASGVAAASGISYFLHPAELRVARPRPGGRGRIPGPFVRMPKPSRSPGRNRAHDRTRGSYGDRLMEPDHHTADVREVGSATLIDAVIPATTGRLQRDVAPDGAEASLTLVDELVDVAAVERSKR